MPLQGVTLSVDAEETIDTLRTHNLLARIPGTERPDETIIYSAHWDHVGGDAQHAAVTGDQICNGAWDNASGTVGVVEMARQLKAAAGRPNGPSSSPIWRPRRWACWARYWLCRQPGLAAGDDGRPTSTSTCCRCRGPTRDCPSSARARTTLEDELQALAEALGRYVTDDGHAGAGVLLPLGPLPVRPHGRAGDHAVARRGLGGRRTRGGRGRPGSAKFAADYHKPSATNGRRTGT